MNILLLADLITFSGVGRYISSLGVKAFEKGHRVIMASPINDLDVGKEDGIVFEEILPISKNPIVLLKNVKRLHEIITKYNIDVVHANHRMCAFLMKLYNCVYHVVPTVWVAHTVPYPTTILKRIFGYYGHISIAISSEAKEFMIHSLKIPEERVKLIINGVDESKLLKLSNDDKIKIKQKWNIGSEKTVFVMHGRIDPIKGHHLVVDAITKLPDDIRENVVIVCSGSYENNPYFEELVRKIDSNMLNDNFRFVGWSETSEILNIADCMLQPSYREGFPLSALEAFFLGVPVVRTKVGGFLDMCDCCIGIDTDDSATLSHYIEQFFRNPRVFDPIAYQAKQFAERNCTTTIMAEKTLSLYQAVIARVKE